MNHIVNGYALFIFKYMDDQNMFETIQFIVSL